MRAAAIPLAGVLLLALGGLLHQQTRTYLEVVQLREKLAAASSRATAAEETLALKHSALSAATAEIARVTHEASAAKAAVHRCDASPTTTKAGPSQTQPQVVEYVHASAADFAPAGTLVMTTYATGGVQEMLRNWVLHVPISTEVCASCSSTCLCSPISRCLSVHQDMLLLLSEC